MTDGPQKPKPNGQGGPEPNRRRKPKHQKPATHVHTHPGGTGAVLGAHLARFSSAQGLSLLISNVLHYASLFAVGALLGARSLGAFALLFFWTSLISQIITVASKPGTIMRTYGVADDDDDDVEQSEEQEQAETLSDRPPYTLGVGIVWCTFLSAFFIALALMFHSEVAKFLLGDSGQGDVVIFATITGGVSTIFKLTEICYWFENRPFTYALIDSSRPAFNLAAVIALILAGEGVKGAVLGQTIGTVAATILCVALLRGTFQLGFSFKELGAILRRGAIRMPIASSMWVVQNADSFLLSRFVDHKELGLYNLASRTGFMAAFLPQGFRMSFRAVKKTAVYRAYRKEYGAAVGQGQMLGYFMLVAFTAILAMALGGELLLHIGGKKFEAVAPIIPLTAAAMAMPSLYRSVGSMSVYPRKRVTFVTSTIFVSIAYVGLVLLLVPNGLGIYGAPVALILAFAIPATYMFLRSQFGPSPIQFPYLPVIGAAVLATVIGGAWHLEHPRNHLLQLAGIAILMLIWFASLFVFRIIPKHHWQPIAHIGRSALRGSPLEFDAKAGLDALAPEDREALRVAVLERMPVRELVASAAGGDGASAGNGAAGDGPAGDGSAGDGSAAEAAKESGADSHDELSQGARLVRLLRRAGEQGGIPIPERSELDAGISLYLFSDEPSSVRQAKMRNLLGEGADAHELRTLEDLHRCLVRAKPQAWGKVGNGNGGRWLIPPGLRRA